MNKQCHLVRDYIQPRRVRGFTLFLKLFHLPLKSPHLYADSDQSCDQSSTSRLCCQIHALPYQAWCSYHLLFSVQSYVPHGSLDFHKRALTGSLFFMCYQARRLMLRCSGVVRNTRLHVPYLSWCIGFVGCTHQFPMHSVGQHLFDLGLV